MLLVISIYYIAQKELTKLDGGNNNNNLSETFTPTTSSTWNRFYSTIGNFNIEFPCVAKTMETNTSKMDNGSDMTNTTYACMGITGSYIVRAVSFPTEPNILDSAKEQGFLEQMLQAYISAMGKNNQLESSSFSEFKDHQSIDFLIYDTNKESYTKGKLFYIQTSNITSFFGLSATSVAIDDIDLNYFINSFQITNK